MAQAPLPAVDLAFDLGTGSGVLGAVLLHRGIGQVVATDISPRAIASARENFARLEYAERVAACVRPALSRGTGGADCLQPTLAARQSWDDRSRSAVYDPSSAMLRGFLDGLADHLLPGGEGWLIMSDLAEHLGLRPHGDCSR